jgi:hypothetical protein
LIETTGWAATHGAEGRERSGRSAGFIDFDNNLPFSLTDGQAWFSFRLRKYGFGRPKNFSQAKFLRKCVE